VAGCGIRCKASGLLPNVKSSYVPLGPDFTFVISPPAERPALSYKLRQNGKSHLKFGGCYLKNVTLQGTGVATESAGPSCGL
jgi:hypothetical protein